MKGQHEVLTLIVMTGILFGVIASVWLWATPIVEKNKEIFKLNAAEDFTKDLAAAINHVAKNGGKAQLSMNGLGGSTSPNNSMLISQDEIDIFVVTQDTLYEKNAQVPLEELNCATTEATWGLNSSAAVCVQSDPIGKDKVRTKFSIRFVQLNYDDDQPLEKKGYKIMLLPLTSSTGLDKSSVRIENKGLQESVVNGRTLISTLVAITIV